MQLSKFGKIIAAGTLATVLCGATVGFATTLADYPSPFVSDGTVSSLIVVGAKADPADVVGAIDIAARLGGEPSTTETKTVTAEVEVPGVTGQITATGDAYKLSKSANVLELGEPVDTIVTTVSKSDLTALAGGSVTNEYGTFTYSEYLEVPDDAYVTWAIDPDDLYVTDTPANYLFFDSGDVVYRYKLSFSTALKSDNDANDELEDLEGKKITLFGKPYTIIDTDHPTDTDVTLTLMGGSESVLGYDETEVTVTVGTTEYTVKPMIYSGTEVIFIVNGETTDKMNEGETYKLADGTEIGVEDIFFSTKESKTSSVKFYVGANKVVLRDSNIESDGTGEQTLTIGSESVSGTAVQITGNSVGIGTGDDVTISQIQITFTAEDDYYVPVNGKLSDVLPKMDTTDGQYQLFLNGFDIEFAGTEVGNTEDIIIQSNGNSKYDLKFTTATGDSVTLPLLYSSGGTNVDFKKDATIDILFLENKTVNQNDYFIVNNDATVGGNGMTHVLQYKDLDATDNTIEFKDIGSGETIKISYVDTAANMGDTTPDGYIILNGNKYGVAVQADSNDANLRIDFNGDGSIDATDEAVIITKYGAKIDLDADGTNDNDVASGGAFLSITTENRENAVAGDTVTFTVTAASGELDISYGTGIGIGVANGGASTMLQLGSSDVYEGYTDYGMKVREEVSTSGPDKIKITYPDDQISAAVFITAGDVTFSESTAGTVSKSVEYTTSTVVPITTSIAKLDTEVTSADKTSKNLILVGGPCVNTLVADLAAAGKVKDGEGVLTCDAWNARTTKFGLIQLIDDAFATGKVALVVAGSTKDETREACSVLQDYANKGLSGTAVKVVNNVISPVTLA